MLGKHFETQLVEDSQIISNIITELVKVYDKNPITSRERAKSI